MCLQAVLEGQWLPEIEKRAPKQMWKKLKLAFMAVNGFRKSLQKPRAQSETLINLHGSDVKIPPLTGSLLMPESSSAGTLSDGGYGSGLMSTEDLRPSQPVAGGSLLSIYLL